MMKSFAAIILFSLFSLTVFGNTESVKDSSAALSSADSLKMAAVNDSLTAAAATDTMKLSAADSINISALVQTQINKARAKLNSAENDVIKTEAPAPVQEKSWFEGLGLPFNLSDSLTQKILIIVLASFLVLGFVFIKRLKSAKKKKPEKILKRNVAFIREERVLKVENNKLSSVRQKLSADPNYLNSSADNLTKRAKELNIAKGELILAAKIKSHELAKVSSVK